MIIWVKDGEIGNDGRRHGLYVFCPEWQSDNDHGEINMTGNRMDTGELVHVSTGSDYRPMTERNFFVTEKNGPGAFCPTYSGEYLSGLTD